MEETDMCKEMMIKYILDSLEELSEDTVSEIYWMLKIEFGD